MVIDGWTDTRPIKIDHAKEEGFFKNPFNKAWILIWIFPDPKEMGNYFKIK